MEYFRVSVRKLILVIICINMSSLGFNQNVETEKRERSINQPKKKSVVKVREIGKEEAIEKLATHILSLEGGYANHKLDRPTNRGVQWQTYKKFAKRLKLDTSKVAFRNLNDKQAKKFIYLFWQLANVDSIQDKRIAAFFVEEFWAAPVSIKFYQQKLNQDFGLCLAEDGGLGTETITAINTIPSTVLIPKLIEWKEERYNRIVIAKPKKVIFQKGWQKRRKLFNELFFDKSNLNQL